MAPGDRRPPSWYHARMTKLEDIEKAVLDLSPEELDSFRNWFEELSERLFDEAIARDAKAGRLDFLVQEAIEEHEAGKTREL